MMRRGSSERHSLPVFLCVGLAMLVLSGSLASAEDAPPEEDPMLAHARMAVRSKDFERAVALWREAASRGSSEAQYRLGVAYRSGRGVDRDLSKAIKWLSRADRAGDAEARFALGMMYRNGLGVERSRDRAIEFFEKAARQGHVDAEEQLAKIARSSSVAFSVADSRVVANRSDPREALTQSIRTADLGSAKEAIARGAPLDGAPGDVRHWRPLVLAIDRGQGEIVDLLLAHKANPNVLSRDGEHALIIAVRAGDRAIVRSLLAAKANPNATSKSKYTALMVAAQQGHEGIVRDLLRARANPESLLSDGTSAASVARRFGHTELYRLLVRSGAPAALASGAADRLDVLEKRTAGGGKAMPPIIEAARRGDLALTREILDRRIPLEVRDAEGEHALGRAIMGGHGRVANALLAAGFDPDLPGARGATPLMRAMESGEAESEAIFASLIKAGADVHARTDRGQAVIDFAATGATKGKLTALEAAGGSWTPIALKVGFEKAAASGRVEVVAALLPFVKAKKARIGGLCRAIEQDEREVVALLLSSQIAPMGDCGSQTTPLSLAARHAEVTWVRSLLDAGAVPDRVSEGADTALIVAASRGYEAVVKLLLERGADVNRRGSRDVTPLMAAASRGQTSVAKRLLAAGADRRMRSDTDHTALELARQAKATETAAAIEDYRGSWLGWLGSEGDGSSAAR